MITTIFYSIIYKVDHHIKEIDLIQLSAPGGKTPEKESVLKKLEEAKAAQFQKKAEQKNHTQEL